jgi:hypothetical protein
MKTVRLYDLGPARQVLEQVGPTEFLHSGDGADLGKLYRIELKCVTTLTMFKNHLLRWRNLYVLGAQSPERSKSELRLLTRFNVKRVYNTWRRVDKGVDAKGYLGDGECYDLAAAITLPWAILKAHHIANHYQCPFNVAMVQAFNQGGWEFF